MKLVFRIAWRYFMAKKSVQAINIISWISMGAIAVAAAAMIILFSVFNGLDHTIKEMYTSFNPELKITPQKGKFFRFTPEQQKKIQDIPGVQYVSETIQDMALLSTEQEQKAAIIKGVDSAWFQVSGMDSFIIEGEYDWQNTTSRNTPAIIGLSIANNLSIDVNNPFAELRIYYPKPGNSNSLNPEKSLSRLVVRPKGIFHIQAELDNQYVLIPLATAQSLFDQQGAIAAVEIKTNRPDKINRIKKDISEIMGTGFTIANRFEQNQDLFMILSGEKWMVYAILLFVLLIASFNLTGCLYMLVLEKKKDISILKSMGFGSRSVRFVFLTEGILLAATGALAGILLGALICLGQIYFGWVGLPDGFVVTAYPVAFEWNDFILVIITALAIGFLAGLYPAFRAGRQSVYLREE